MVEINGRPIDQSQPPYLIAELSANHNGQRSRALDLINLAKEAGADAVKLQTYTADTMTIDHDGPGFTIDGGLWDGRTLYDLYREAHTPWEWHADLFQAARDAGITMFSSPFDATALEMLEELGCPAYKIASFEVVDIPLIAAAASTGKPLIISTGMATLEEVADAVVAARYGGCETPMLLHCVSSYPTSVEASNVGAIVTLRQEFGVPVGFSDHSVGTEAAVLATAVGAVAIEKHFTDSRAATGTDSAFSMEVEEFHRLRADTTRAWTLLGDGVVGRLSEEEANAKLRRSLYVVADVLAGEPFTSVNVRSIRPAQGLAPKHLPRVLKATAATNLPRGTPLKEADLEEGPT